MCLASEFNGTLEPCILTEHFIRLCMLSEASQQEKTRLSDCIRPWYLKYHGLEYMGRLAF